MRNKKLRYYLRGLGIGILVTAVILGIAGKDTEELTDAQIRERAMELGMVDSNSLVLAELQKGDEQLAEATEQSQPQPTEDESAETEQTETSETESEPSESEDETQTAETESSEKTENETVGMEAVETEPQPENETQNTEVVSITIKAGASSYTVAKDLAEAGLVADARAYDTYLCDNGYSQSIHVGTYEITFGATDEEIAKIITGKN